MSNNNKSFPKIRPSPSKNQNNNNSIMESPSPNKNNNNKGLSDGFISLSQRKRKNSRRRKRSKLNLTEINNGIHMNYANSLKMNETAPTTNFKTFNKNKFNPNKQWHDLTKEEKDENNQNRQEINQIENLKINEIIKNWKNKPNWEELKMLKCDLLKSQLQIQYRWMAKTDSGNWFNNQDKFWDKLSEFIPILKKLKLSIIKHEPYGKGEYYKVFFVYHSNETKGAKIFQRLSGINSAELWFYSVIKAMNDLN